MGESRLARNAPAPNEQDWQPPILTGGFKPRIASSIVEEFVAGHDAGDVLRELVQNEFDAGGTQVSVTFGRFSLIVVGNGRPILMRKVGRGSMSFLGPAR
jgi:hypothetical protein